MLDELAQRSAQGGAQPRADDRFAALPVDTRCDDRQPHGSQSHRERHAVLEDRVRQVAEIERDANTPKDGKDAP
jgi:hypothetical protein